MRRISRPLTGIHPAKAEIQILKGYSYFLFVLLVYLFYTLDYVLPLFLFELFDIKKSIFRASNAPHRSLPDIPVTESLNDNVSELYATVADKIQQKPQGRSRKYIVMNIENCG